MAARGAERTPYGNALALGTWAWANRGLIEGRVVLAGGDPSRMSLRHFIDCAYTILVEEYTRLGIDLVSALEKVSALGTTPPLAEGALPPPDRVDNDRSMQMLTSMMAGVKGAPV